MIHRFSPFWVSQSSCVLFSLIYHFIWLCGPFLYLFFGSWICFLLRLLVFHRVFWVSAWIFHFYFYLYLYFLQCFTFCWILFQFFQIVFFFSLFHLFSWASVRSLFLFSLTAFRSLLFPFKTPWTLKFFVLRFIWTIFAEKCY